MITISNESRLRRGMLILVVLGMLSLFLLMGAMGLVLATRARESALAFSSSSASKEISADLARSMLDEALLRLVRGPSVPGVLQESLLEDKYGPPYTPTTKPHEVRITSITPEPSTPLLAAVISGTSLNVGVNGRILTLIPNARDAANPSSYRVIRTETGTSAVTGTTTVTGTVWLANTRPFVPTALPTVMPCDGILNGREFMPLAANSAPEGFDAFDPLEEANPSNAFLARLPLSNSRVEPGGLKPSFWKQGADIVVDNDNDGVPDGIWLQDEKLLPSKPTPRGGELKFHVSYLVVDLDGRINLNAHGSLAPVEHVASDYAKAPASVPRGSGWGPADVDASLIIPPENPSDEAPHENWQTLLRGGKPTERAASPSDVQRRVTPVLGKTGNTLEGRYGSNPQPGAPGNDKPQGIPAAEDPESWIADSGTNAPTDIRSPTDLKARVKTFTAAGGVVPTLVFFRPSAWTDANDTDVANDPYEVRLDTDGPRISKFQHANAAGDGDNLYTLGELERILRQFDADASTLPPRLATVLDDFAERSRMTVTTDSWDTPAMVGEAARKVVSYAQSFSGTSTTPYDILSPDVAMGLRFDVNRPLENDALRQLYFQHLYTLLVALGEPATDATAQWAANVIEFRDPDSTMSRYQYDTNPTDGWAPTASVWGAERPELVITQTLAYESQFFVVLHHPWNAERRDKSTTVTPTELIDPNLAPPPADIKNAADANSLELRRKAGGDRRGGGGDSIWRLRVNNSATVRFGDHTTNAALKLPPNGTLCVGTGSGPGMGSLVVSGLSNAGATEVFLERLADPTKAFNDPDNPYVTVDRARVQVFPDKDTAQRLNRGPLFWRSANDAFAGEPGNSPSPPSSGSAVWFHWPNRPFVSHAELLLVPRGNARAMLENFASPLPTAAGSPSTPMVVQRPELLDATIVPSRFSGMAYGIPNRNQSLSKVGLQIFPFGQISRWREPGRINVNTVVENHDNSPLSSLDDAVWRGLTGKGSHNPFSESGSPAKTSLEMLANPAIYPDANPARASTGLAASTAIRLGNAGTIRSNVFAVWITLKIEDTSANAEPPSYHRLFAIVDRSIPVGYAPGRTLNVRDAIRLQRFLE